ncbi:MAG: ABC-type transport auxiliary lipoprotein family protein [Brachymonas sp.]|nr:ABC-type transport auxiliary lipoprotein family protein [Brachymonas sp.]
MTHAPARSHTSPRLLDPQSLLHAASPAQPGAAQDVEIHEVLMARLTQPMHFKPFVHLAKRFPIASSIARWATALGASGLIAACSILPAATPVDTYVLPSAQHLPATTASPAANSPALRIARPVANGVLAGKRIVVMPQADRLQVYQGAVWNEAPPQLLRNRLLDAFMTDGHLPTVDTDEGPSAQVDYLLASQLRSFHSVYENGSALPTALVRVDAQLIHTGSNRIVASRSFVVKQPAASKEVPAVVQALGQAADQVAQQMVDWAASHAKHSANHPAAGHTKR